MDGLQPIAHLQRARGEVGLSSKGAKINRLYQAGCAKLMLPKTYGAMTEAVILNTAGGVTGGDRLAANIIADDCHLAVTSQTAERLYRSSTSPAKIDITLSAQNGARLHWIPQETIIFDGAEVDRTIRLDMADDCHCLLAETIVLGRQAMGESVERCHFTDQWRLYRGGKLLHAEALRLTGDIKAVMNATAGGMGAKLLTSIFYAGPDSEAISGLIAPLIETHEAHQKQETIYAASYWQDKLVIRLASTHAPSARAIINDILTTIRQQPLPRVWQV